MEVGSRARKDIYTPCFGKTPSSQGSALALLQCSARSIVILLVFVTMTGLTIGNLLMRLPDSSGVVIVSDRVHSYWTNPELGLWQGVVLPKPTILSLGNSIGITSFN